MHNGPRMPLSGNLEIPWPIFLVRGSMTPSFDCIVKPDSLSVRNSPHYLYEGLFGSRYPSGHVLCRLGTASRGEKRC